ncbi:transport and Golgi organization protein 1 homolog [Aplochiton taeniatus]
MAAYILCVFLLWVHNFVSTTTVERRFSDFKRCADEECSMLLCRGKAVSDFNGPDCRFLSFKKSETIYVYYKLSGRRTNIWAGTVGSRFGYFPSDFLAVNHIYTDKELEIPAEETDFVCFDTGHDKFDSYDVDSLLGSSLITGNDDTLDQINIEESVDAETEMFIGEAGSGSSETDDNDLEDIASQDIDKVPEPPFDEGEIQNQFPIKEADSQDYNIGDESQDLEVEKEGSLLEDENALLSTLQHELPSKTQTPPVETNGHLLPNSELEYSEDVLRLTLLREHFSGNVIQQLHTLLGLKNLFRVEAMFSDLEQELKAATLSHTDTPDDIEKALENIFEASETSILDEIESMLDAHNIKNTAPHQTDTSLFDEEAAILDDFQELAFKLRQRYSTISESVPLATGNPSDANTDEIPSDAVEEELMFPSTDEEKFEDNLTDTEVNDNHIIPEVDDDPTEPNMDGNFTVPELEENLSLTEVKEEFELDKLHKEPDMAITEDGGYFNKNEDNQQSFKATENIQTVPQAFLDKHLEAGLGLEIEHSSSGPLDSQPVSEDFVEEESGLFLVGMFYLTTCLSLIKTKVIQYYIVVISLLPEEWKPGPMFFGWPWQPVVTTAAIGVVTIMLFFWRTVMAVINEKGLNDQIEALKKQKSEALKRISELQTQAEDYKEKQIQSEETTSYALLKIKELESLVLEVEARNEKLSEEKNLHGKFIDEERAKTQTHESQIEKLEKSKERLQLSRKKTQEALAKTTILLDEAKIREDTRNVQHQCLEKDHASLKEQNKSLKAAIKGWEEKHKELREQIKAYQKSQKELEDSVALKDHNVEVLSELLADLDACDLQKGDGRVVANGGTADEKTDIKNRIKQMMDVSRVQMTLSVVEEERDRFMAKLLNEEKARKELEEHHQVLDHSIVTLKSEKSHVENQLKVLQQKNEIMTEMYQQKENALQQKLTKEELERRSKETMLSEVGGKALVAEEEVKLFRQRIEEIREEMKKTESSLKEQIKEQESKTHEHWVTARTAERNLSEEKKETPHLRSQLAVLTSQLNERRAPLFRPNHGQFMSARQGSYGPSPVSGGAPSPPPMIEGPRRPPSAPVGRRSDPFGPRPPSDPHGRYPDNKYNSGTDMIAPRTSSPTNMDGSTVPVESETQAEASTESPESMSGGQGPGSFLASPIRDSPGPMAQGPLLASGPHGLPPPGHKFIRAPNQGPHGPHIMGPIYPPGPGMTGHLAQHAPNGPPPHGQPLPANGHPGMRPAGPMGEHPFGPRPSNGHAFRPRPGHDMVDPRFAPPPLRFRPPAHPFGPMPPLHVTRGPMGPRPPFPPDMHFQGPRDHPYPPQHLPPGAPVPPPLTRGGSFGQAPPESPYDSSVGPHHGQAQNFPSHQGPVPQDPASSAMVEP